MIELPRVEEKELDGSCFVDVVALVAEARRAAEMAARGHIDDDRCEDCDPFTPTFCPAARGAAEEAAKEILKDVDEEIE